MYYYLHISLLSVATILIKHSYAFIHERLYFSILVKFLPHLVSGFSWPQKICCSMVLFLCLWKDLCKTGISSLFNVSGIHQWKYLNSEFSWWRKILIAKPLRDMVLFRFSASSHFDWVSLRFLSILSLF